MFNTVCFPERVDNEQCSKSVSHIWPKIRDFDHVRTEKGKFWGFNGILREIIVILGKYMQKIGEIQWFRSNMI